MRPIQKNVFYLNCTEILEAGIIRKDFKQRYCSWWLSNKESTHNVGDVGSVPGFGKSPGERNCSPLQYSCLGKSMGIGAWWTTVHGVTRVRCDLAAKQ